MKLDYATVLCIAYIPAENTPIVDTVATPETSLSVSITYSPLTSLVPRPYRSETRLFSVSAKRNRLLDGSDASDPAGGLLGSEGTRGGDGSLCHAAR